MTRVSLKEAYDNKDVVAQIYAIRDIAEGAEDTADSAVTTANTASAHVDALVPQVEGAVQNANNASASAQASAQTVAGYENRLSAVEGDLNAVTLRVTTAEGQIVTIQGRVTALETADGQNVKLTGTQTIGGVKHFADSPTAPTTETGLWDVQVANGEKVKNELDNYEPMVRTVNAQTIAGEKTFANLMKGDVVVYEGGSAPSTSTTARTNYYNVLEITPSSRSHYRIAILGGLNNNTVSLAEIEIVFGSVNAVNYVVVYNKSSNAGRAVKIKVTRATENNKIRLWVLEGQFIDYRAYVLRTTNNGKITRENVFSVPGTMLSDPTAQEDYLSTVTESTFTDYPIEV